MKSCRTQVLDLDLSWTRVRFLEDLDLDSKVKDLDLKGEDLELGLWITGTVIVVKFKLYL